MGIRGQKPIAERPFENIDGLSDYPLSAAQKEVLEYWYSKSNASAPPRRSDIDVLDLRLHMPHIMMFDVERDPDDFRYRLVGTRVRENSFEDYTGKYLSELEGKGPDSQIWKLLSECRDRGEPMCCAVPNVGPFSAIRRASALFLPLQTQDPNAMIVMVMMSYEQLLAA